MALITCPECKRKVSDDALTCVGCGRQLKAKPMSGCAMAIAVVIITALLIPLWRWLAGVMGLS